MSDKDDAPLMDMFEGSLQNIERRFGRSRRGALIQLGSTFMVLGLFLALLLPVFLPDHIGLSRRTSTLTLDNIALFTGLFVMGLGGFILWQIRSLNKDVPPPLPPEV